MGRGCSTPLHQLAIPLYRGTTILPPPPIGHFPLQRYYNVAPSINYWPFLFTEVLQYCPLHQLAISLYRGTTILPPSINWPFPVTEVLQYCPLHQLAIPLYRGTTILPTPPFGHSLLQRYYKSTSINVMPWE